MRRSGEPKPTARRVVAGLLVAGVLAFGAGTIAGVLPCSLVRIQPTCYLAIAPGPLVDTVGLIAVDGASTTMVGDDDPDAAADHGSTEGLDGGRPQGQLLLTTIVVTDGLAIGDWWAALRSGEVDTTHRDALFPPGADADQVRRRNAVAMRDSQLEATIAAMHALGLAVDARGVRVIEIAVDAVGDQLAVDDVIVAVNGWPVTSSTQLVGRVSGLPPGHHVALDVVRAGRFDDPPLKVNVTLTASDEDPTQGRIGVLVTSDVELPVEVSIDAGDVGGPSAGMMFALAIIHALSDTEVLDGRVVAGTGVVRRDGTVLAVGGVRQKLTAVSAHSPTVDVFLVPRGNLADARRAPVRAPVLVVPVDSLDDARAALAELAAGRQPAEAEFVGRR